MHKEFAIITDIHGNSEALKAVLSDIDRESNAAHIYCLGDLVAIGHETNEVLEQLSSRDNVTYVKGNHEEAILNIVNGDEPGSSGEERAHHYWIAKKMDERYISFLQHMPKSFRETINGKKLLFVHYHLDSDEKFLPIDKEPSSTRLDEIYKNDEADLVCFGHHHILHHFKSSSRIYLNPGALGCNHKAVATYALVRVRDDGDIACTVKEVPYTNSNFLKGYFDKNVPGKKTLVSIFHGNQHSNASRD